MKNKIFISGVISLSILLVACEDLNLNREFVTTLSKKQVDNSYTFSSYLVASVYVNLPRGFLNVGGAMMASATDEAEHTLETSAIQNFNTGSWNAIINPDDVWATYYKGIRKANQFLLSADSVNLDQYKLDPELQTTYIARLAEIKRWKYEVRFLRAYFYFELVKRYGGVPLITNAGSINDDYSNVKRDSLATCIRFITNECDSAAAVLPLPSGYTSVDLGRATKGAALALKSRVLLFAASDLFNTPSWAGSFTHPELISLTGDRQARWKAAADAAKAVIDLNAYTWGTSYNALFGSASFSNKEVILVRRDGPSNSFEMASYPIGYDLGNSGTTPSQNLVDAYEMTDGTKFDWTNPTHEANPFANRDPRLALTVLTNNTTFKGRPVECWTGGRDGKGVALATKTGYYLRKYVDESLNLLTNTYSVHNWILMRLPEMYLNYAEALNEYSPGHADIKIYVDKVRARTGVNMPGLPTGLSQADMRERIRNERRVEFAFEDFRFWDVRRWMQAPQYLGVPLTGLQITKTGASTFSYQKIDVENRVFESKMYLYPIPQNELYIAKDLVQNPLW